MKKPKQKNHSHLGFISTLLPDKPIEVSFEFFPPKTEKMEQSLWKSIKRLEPLQPRFVSVTYGAGGSTRERTHSTVRRILQETSLVPAAHLTCVGATKEEINHIAQDYWNTGVRHIVALRGDPPEDQGLYTPHPNGYAYAADLVKGLKQVANFEISVAAYPETHPEALSPDSDIDNLKRKIEAGATRAITQYFFDVELYLNFLERVRKAGITVPIVPGILMIHNFKNIDGFSKRCGASVPQWLSELFEGLEDDFTTQNLLAASIAIEQCRRLYNEGVNEFHFYTLNRGDLAYAICHALGLRSAHAETDRKTTCQGKTSIEHR